MLKGKKTNVGTLKNLEIIAENSGTLFHLLKSHLYVPRFFTSEPFNGINRASSTRSVMRQMSLSTAFLTESSPFLFCDFRRSGSPASLKHYFPSPSWLFPWLAWCNFWWAKEPLGMTIITLSCLQLPPPPLLPVMSMSCSFALVAVN